MPGVSYVASLAEQGAFRGVKQLKGSGAANYTTASTVLVAIDSTNLSYAVYIPKGFAAKVYFGGAGFTATLAVSMSVALQDGASVLSEVSFTASGATAANGSFSLSAVVVGDNAVHTFAPYFLTSAAADVATIVNSSAALAPVMLVEVVESSF